MGLTETQKKPNGQAGGIPASMTRPRKLRFQRPQHLHVIVYAFREVDDKGDFTWSTRFEYIVQDKDFALDLAKQDAYPEQKQFHMKESRQCPDPKCLEGIPE